LPRLIAGLAELAECYDIILCDVWGVVHNGAAAFLPALDALARFRASGGAVTLITNSPAPSRIVEAQLDSFGAPRAAYDAIVSSGDVTASLLMERAGQSLFHIGAAAETGLFDEVAAKLGEAPRQTGIENADFVLCTGFIDFWREKPEDYDARLKRIHERGLDFICANPDLVVEVDGVLSYCAGAIAERYQRLGGKVIQAGKPFAPIYDRALALAASARGAPADRSRVLAIGDSMRTDIGGAAAQGFDSLFVTSGIHRDELHAGASDPGAGGLNAAALRQFVEAAGLAPTAAIAELVW
jgi:HAD superfamily hydrolase (TIGR01459 family)